MTIFEDEMEKRKKQSTLADGNTGLNTSGVVGGGYGSSAPTQTAAQGPAGSGFVNLNQYLDLNQGTGKGLASELNKGLESDVGAFKDDTAKQTSTIKGSMNQAVSAAGDKASFIKTGLATDATANVGAAKDFLNSSYSGPTAATPLAGIASNQKVINDRLGLVDNRENIQQGLEKNYGYNKGFGQLDSFLMQGDKSGRDELARIKGRTGEVDSAYTGAKDQLTAAETAAINDYSAIKNDVVGEAKKIRGDVEGRAKEDAGRMGAGRSGYDGYSAASMGNVLSQDQIDDLNVLADLSGDARGVYAKTYNEGSAPVPKTVAQPTGAPVVDMVRAGTTDRIPENKTIDTLAHIGGQTIDTIDSGGKNITMAQTNKVVQDMIDRTKKSMGDSVNIPLGKQSVAGALSNLTGMKKERFKLPGQK